MALVKHAGGLLLPRPDTDKPIDILQHLLACVEPDHVHKQAIVRQKIRPITSQIPTARAIPVPLSRTLNINNQLPKSNKARHALRITRPIKNKVQDPGSIIIFIKQVQ